MGLDLLIQNTMRRSPMEGALHSLGSDLGDGHYRLNAFYSSESEATEILGRAIDYAPNPATLYVAPPNNMNETQKMSSITKSFGEFTVSYNGSTSTWTLKKMGTGFFARLMRRESVLFSKSGQNATNRFLTTVEESTLDPSAKAKITEIVIAQTDNTGISEYVGGGQIVHSSIDNVYDSQAHKLAGHSAAEVLAADYVRPRPLTGYTPVRNEIGDSYGMRMQPQATVMGAESLPIRFQDFQSF
jgi:hypothetical protein